MIICNECECTIFVNCKCKSNFCVTGKLKLFGFIANKCSVFIFLISFGQEPTEFALKINRFYKYIAILIECNCELTIIIESIIAKIFPIFIATIVNAVDPTNEIISFYIIRIDLATFALSFNVCMLVFGIVGLNLTLNYRSCNLCICRIKGNCKCCTSRNVYVCIVRT